MGDSWLVGIAPIGWTNDDMPELGGEIPFEQCIDEMALAGYAGCEVGGKFPRDIPTLTDALADRVLRICNAWFSSYLVDGPAEETYTRFRTHCEFLAAMGARIVGISEQSRSIQGAELPILGAKPVFTDAEWDRLAAGISGLAGIAREHGITLTFHHHMGTGVQTREETRRLLEATSPEDLSLLYDTGHFAFAGEDHLECLREFVPRVRHVHLKDIRAHVLEEVRAGGTSFLDAVRAGVFTVPGDGSLDYTGVFDLLREANYEGWLVVEAEQDPARANPLDYARRGRGYIRRVGGV